MNQVGNPTPLCKQLRKRKDKPHFFIWRILGDHYLNAVFPLQNIHNASRINDFCWERTPGYYKSIGDAARAWRNYGGEL